jgi:hypothetical protein
MKFNAMGRNIQKLTYLLGGFAILDKVGDFNLGRCEL